MLVMSTGGFNELLPETEEEEGPSCEGWLSAWFPGLPPTNGLRFAYAATGHKSVRVCFAKKVHMPPG